MCEFFKCLTFVTITAVQHERKPILPKKEELVGGSSGTSAADLSPYSQINGKIFWQKEIDRNLSNLNIFNLAEITSSMASRERMKCISL